MPLTFKRGIQRLGFHHAEQQESGAPPKNIILGSRR